jgi:stress-induced morphogen
MKLEVQIRNALTILQPSHVELLNESDSHRGPPGRESHFKLLIVSDAFAGLSRVQRQQKIYALLDFAFKTGLHALSLRTLTNEEWKRESGSIFESPDCTGGVGKKS